MNWLRRYWGFVALLIAIGLWSGLAGSVTSALAGLILMLSVGAFGYLCFQAPLAWCGAQIRGGNFCRNNCSGLLLGCHLRQHKWQKIMMAFRPSRWPELNRVLWSGAKQVCGTLSGLVAFISSVVAVVEYLK